MAGERNYFWESSPARALQFAGERAAGGKNSRGHIQKLFVIGAVINLAACLNLTAPEGLSEGKAGCNLLQAHVALSPLPKNKGKLRNLDCIVINPLHQIRTEQGLQLYDTVRGVFWEGQELYAGFGFLDQDHVQICVRNTDCILGYFRPTANQN